MITSKISQQQEQLITKKSHKPIVKKQSKIEKIEKLEKIEIVEDILPTLYVDFDVKKGLTAINDDTYAPLTVDWKKRNILQFIAIESM